MSLIGKQRYLLLAVLFLIGVLAVWWYIGGGVSLSTPKSEHTILLEENETFARAESFFGDADCATAGPLYEEALATARTNGERGQINFKIGICAYSIGDYLRAIPILKEVVADPENSDFIRAYSVQYLGVARYEYYADPKIDEEVFRDEPYRSLWVEGNVRLSYRRLFEYASALYPLAISELRIAEWYASGLLLREDTLPPDEIARYRSIVMSKLASAEVDIARIQSLQNEKGSFLAALRRKAVVLGMLARLGDIPISEAETAFEASIEASRAVAPAADSYARYSYALFLAQLEGEQATAAVHALLSPFYDSTIYSGDPIETYFKSARATNSPAKVAVARLGALDPGFKTYLISLGWQESDFK